MKPVVLRNNHGATTALRKSATGGIIGPALTDEGGTETFANTEGEIGGSRGIGSARNNLGEGTEAVL